jgi:predicted nuclease of restriction endonuclease-like RecB superfamily
VAKGSRLRRSVKRTTCYFRSFHIVLTREQAINEIDFARGSVVPDRLTTAAHGRYLNYAERMVAIYRQGTGRTRRDLHRAVDDVFADQSDCPQRRIDAFCKLLDDAGVFERDRRGRAAILRRDVFRMAAPRHPLVRTADRLFENGEARVKLEIAESLGRSWSDIEAGLFADIVEFHRLERFNGFADGRALLSRYNVAQVQAALFDAQSMSVWAADDFKTIIRYAKLARLMHTILRLESGEYLFRFDGAASAIRETRRYGAALARFLPALIACRGWRMHAIVESRHTGRKLSLDLAATDGLTSHLPSPEEFDSQIEADFAAKWGTDPREGWTLIREGEILHQGQKVFVPDFVFRHTDGRTVLLEIIGFWTPEYLESKVTTLSAFGQTPILLAVAEPIRTALPNLSNNIVTYKTTLKLRDILEKLG